MASTYSDLLRIEKQGAGENENTWGTIVNTQFELFEDAIAGLVAMSDADVALSTVNGLSDQARNMILDFKNTTLTTNRTVTVPDLSKLYVIICEDVTFGGFTITIRATTLGDTFVISSAENHLVAVREVPGGGPYDVFGMWAQASGTPALAANSNQLGGVAAASYARLDTSQGFTAGQTIVPTDLATTGAITPDLDTANSFEAGPLTGNITLNNPTNGNDHQFFTVVVRQSSGTLRTITWGPAYEFPGGVSPTLTATANRVDVFTFIWVAALSRALLIGAAQDIPNS